MYEQDPLPLPVDPLTAEVGRVYLIPEGQKVFLSVCGDCLGGCVRNGIYTQTPSLHRINYEPRKFMARTGQQIRVAPRPTECTDVCPGICANFGRYNSDTIYCLTTET